jgi:hypothetical protein
LLPDEPPLGKKKLKLGAKFIICFLLKVLFGVIFGQEKIASNTTMHDDELI